MESSYFLRSLDVLITFLMISMLLASWRLYQGPDTPNRTVAFDLIAIHAVGIIALFSIRLGSSYLLDVAIITAVLGFLGTMMLARYLERSTQEGWKDDQR